MGLFSRFCACPLQSTRLSVLKLTASRFNSSPSCFRRSLLPTPLGFLLFVETTPDQFKDAPAQSEQRHDEEFDKAEIAFQKRIPSRPRYPQLTTGGIELRMVSMLPPVCSPNMVPRS